MDMELFKEMAAKAQGKSLIGACLAEIEALRQQLASVAKERDEIAAQSRMLDCMVDERDEQLAAALVAIEEKDAALSAIIGATRSHVDGRDLLAELHPRHYMDIRVRRNGKDIWFEADWLSNLQRAITSYKTTIPIKPDASALKQHVEQTKIGMVRHQHKGGSNSYCRTNFFTRRASMLNDRIRPNIEATHASAPEGKALWDSVYKTLRNYRMTMMVDSDGDGYPLIDAMSPEQGTIEIGIEECTYLADAIYNDLLAAAPTPPVSEDRKDAERFRFMLDDHAEKTTRQRVRELFERLPVMSLSAARAAIDAAMQEDKP